MEQGNDNVIADAATREHEMVSRTSITGNMLPDNSAFTSMPHTFDLSERSSLTLGTAQHRLMQFGFSDSVIDQSQSVSADVTNNGNITGNIMAKEGSNEPKISNARQNAQLGAIAGNNDRVSRLQ